MQLTTSGHLRWMIRADLSKILSYEKEVSEEMLIKDLRSPHCIGKILEIGEEVVGYMIYKLFPRNFQITRLVTHPSWRRCGVATRLITHLKSYKQAKRSTIVFLDVPEDCLDLHLFLRSQDFLCHQVTSAGYSFRWVRP